MWTTVGCMIPFDSTHPPMQQVAVCNSEILRICNEEEEEPPTDQSHDVFSNTLFFGTDTHKSWLTLAPPSTKLTLDP